MGFVDNNKDIVVPESSVLSLEIVVWQNDINSLTSFLQSFQSQLMIFISFIFSVVMEVDLIEKYRITPVLSFILIFFLFPYKF